MYMTRGWRSPEPAAAWTGMGKAVVCFILWASSAANALAQDSEQQLLQLRQWNSVVLQALREGDLVKSLEAWGEAADLSSSIQTSEDGGFAAVAGGMHRALTQLSTDEQYDLLHQWSMPTESRRTVRILSTVVPQNAPPKELARVLRERPRENSFPVAEIGGIRGLFSSGWTLVQAAEDVGRLRQLTAELDQLVAQQVPNADQMLALAQLASRRGDISAVRAFMLNQIAELQVRISQPGALSESWKMPHVVLAAAALGHQELQSLSEQLLKLLAESPEAPVTPLRAFLRVTHATAVQAGRGQSGPEALHSNRLKYWVPMASHTAKQHAAGAIDAMWLVHEDHILHLAGAHNDVLFCRYPLTGVFEFSCEAQIGGPPATDGGLAYGGLQFEALGSTGRLTVWDADLNHQVLRPCPFVRTEQRPTFNHLAMRSTDEGATLAVNLHPMWSDGASATSPWLGLRSFGHGRPVFRNLKITGRPIIPREVRMTAGNQLRGWQSQFFGETKPSFAAAADQVDPDWNIADGVIVATKRDDQANASSQSLLRYQRPLLVGESVSYEFLYAPGEMEVHPSLGRLAFLIEPAGVRIHWITDGAWEWTGLPEDNATLEPLNRRGSRELPLRENQWNRVILAHHEGKAAISLNGELVYERPVDFQGDHAFGLYRDRTKAAAKVRNVIMTGDWPESLPEDFLKNPAAVIAEPVAMGGRHLWNGLVDPAVIADNARYVRRHAARLANADRFQFLCDWILPGDDHPDFRIAGEFTQTDPAPLAVEEEPVPLRHPVETMASVQRGGGIISPVFDLLDLAAETGRLEELRDRISEVEEPDDQLNQRAKAALLALVYLELDEPEAVDTVLVKLQSLAAQEAAGGLYELWPETLVVYRGMHRFPAQKAIGDLLIPLYSQYTLRLEPGGVEQWHTHIASLMGRYWHRERGNSDESFDKPGDLGPWVPVVRTRGSSRGEGFAHAKWQRNSQNEMHQVAGHQEEYLFYQLPLRGDFQVEGDIGAYGTTQAFVAGSFYGPKGDHNQLETGTFRSGARLQPFDPPFSKFDSWVRFRTVVNERMCQVFLNGRLVHQTQLSEHHDPWIGFRSWWRNKARFRDVRVTGNPQIPDAIVMSALRDLTGWLPYHEDRAGSDGAHWQWMDDPASSGQIIGRQRTDIQGSHYESLLRYHRPLIEDGSIEYDFYHEPGKSEVQPALDRLAFILDPGGVRIHWITDGRFDRTGVAPDNVVVEPRNRRGPAMLPLKPEQWNHLKLSLVGRTATLELNDQIIYERELEPTNARTFGLFHYSDRCEARVRNVILRGDWPTSLPPVDQQQLADPAVVALDADLPKLQSIFTHDFAKDGVPDRYFSLHGTSVSAQSDGIHMTNSSSGGWAQSAIILRFALQGDFDIEARFEQLQVQGCEKEGGVHLFAKIQDAQSHHLKMVRARLGGNRQALKGQMSVAYPDGTRRYIDSIVAEEGTAGRLRIARRGEQVYSLFAQGDSSEFRLIGEETATAGQIAPEGLQLLVVAFGAGQVRAVWKDITLRAERMTLVPDVSTVPRELCVMKADGSDLRVVTKPLTNFTHLGSPEWSSDSTKIALDMSRGSTTSSHIIVINADGSNSQDLGPGCMPSFSRDGKRMVFSQPGQGIVMMHADGTRREVIDAGGWGVQWSPDGRYIAYGKSGNIVLMNVDTRDQRLLLVGEQATRYSSTYWNLGWSHDSRLIAFKGLNSRTGDQEVAVADVESALGFKSLYKSSGHINADFTWSPDNKRVLFAMNSPAHNGLRLFLVDRAGSRPPQLLTGQPLDRKILDCAWSPDGQHLVFSSQPEPRPVEWPPGGNAE